MVIIAAVPGTLRSGRNASRSIATPSTPEVTIVTTNANPVLRLLHERMPVILEPAAWPTWLGEVDGDPPDLLRPSEAELRVWRVGKAVNNVRNDSAELLEPV